MYPANHYMDPYHSHYRNHAPYPYYPPPTWEIPSGHPRAMDSSYYRPPSCGTWPYNHGMHQSHPSEFHCCCNQTYPPGNYSFRPPFPQELPPPHLYYHGPFPQYPNAYPSYFVPSHPYPTDHAPYGYDKFKSHCCGCPNHVCPGAEKSNVKIEEERPDVKLESDHKSADRGSIIQHQNNKYPFVWLPSGNTSKENGEHYKLSPQILNEWAPVNSKRLGDVKQQEQDNQTGKQFQWPIVWMPAGYDAPNQKAKEMNNDTEETPNSPKLSEEAPQSPKIKIIPLSWFENGHHHDQKPAARNGYVDHDSRSAVKSQPVVTDHQDSMTLEGNPKTTPAVPKSTNDDKKPLRENCKTIPVVPEKEINEKKTSTYRTIPVMKESDEKKIGMREKKEAKEANSAEKVEENRKTKRSDSSTAKHSKLPPVCLRVDPLPRKKSGNGSSRSPSPPTRKSADNMKDSQSQNLEPKQSGTSNHIAVSEVKEKSPYEMNKEIGFRNEAVQTAAVDHSQEEESPTSKDDHKVQAGSTIVGTQENTGAKSIQGGALQENASAGSLNGCDKSKNEDGTVIESEAAKDDANTYRVNLSEPDAAVRIQSAFRGYDVRRWQPLDKLRKIRHVHEQMQGVKKQLQCLENSCNKPTQKDQVAIGETIMNLLLKLDTIQGLHPSVREARKTVARELICLQEKLDTLCRAPSGDLNQTNSNDDDESERTESIIRTAAPSITTEASDRKSQQERAVEMGEVDGPSSVSMEPCNTVPCEVSLEVRPDAASEEKNEKQESCSTTVDEAHEGKAEGRSEFQVASSMDMISDAAITEHPTDNQEHGIVKSNVNNLVEQVTEEEKPAAEDEVKESPLVNYDTASSGDSSGLKQYTASTNQNLYAESNTGFSPASIEDIDTSALTAPVESEVATEKDSPVDSQVHETATLENVELKDDVSCAENEHDKSSRPVVHLEDPLVPLKDVEQHGLTQKDVSTEDQQEASDISLQVQAVDSMEDSGKIPDGTIEVSINDDLELGTSAEVAKLDQPTMLEPRLESASAPELTVLDESYDKMQFGVSCEDELPHMDEKTETTVDKVTGGSANCKDPLCEASKESDICESHPSVGEETDDTTGGTVFPDSDSNDGGITVCEEPEMMSSENQTDESDDKMQFGVSCEDEVPHDERTETSVGKVTGGSANCKDQASKKEPDICVSHPIVGEEADDTTGGTVFPDSDSRDLSSCPHNGGITVCEEPEIVSSENQTDAQKENIYSDVSETDECTKTQKAAPVGMGEENSTEDSDVRVSEMDKCNEIAKEAPAQATGANPAEDEASLKEDITVSEMDKCNEILKEAPAHATGANPAEDEASLKEDITVQTENKASASPSPDDPKVSDEKELAEENQKLKELLQKLLTSSNDQMGVITNLSEKVNALERKLAHKRPKVRVHRPSRHAAAKVH